MLMIRSIQLAMQNAVKSVMVSGRPDTEINRGEGVYGGAFTRAFSEAFDIYDTSQQFSNAFSDAFSSFANAKQFTSAFSPAFANH